MILGGVEIPYNQGLAGHSDADVLIHAIIDAILGATLEVPTVYGTEKINIPSGSQTGDTIKIRNKGFKNVTSDSYGDQIVHLVVKVPTSLSREEKAMYESLRQAESKGKNRPTEAYTDKVKKMYKL